MHFLTTASPQFLAQQATVQAKKVLKAYYPARGDCGLNAHLTGDELGWRLAALVDGEGSFAISVSGRTRKSFRCSFLLGMRDDDRPFLELMRDSTGWGILFNIRRTEKALARRPGSKPMVHWQIERIHDLYDAQDALVARADEGRPVVVPDPGTPYGRCLVLFLGATIKETT